MGILYRHNDIGQFKRLFRQRQIRLKKWVRSVQKINLLLCYQLLLDKGFNTNKIIVSGGGAKSDLWCQILSDVMDAKVIKMSTDEGPSLGVCILGSVASNIYGTIEEASRMFLKVKKTYTPIPDHASKYHMLYGIYHSLYGNLKDTFQKTNSFVVKYSR